MTETLPILLLLVAVMAGWEAQGILRRGGPSRRVFGAMLAGCAVAALVAMAGLKDDPQSRAGHLIGAIAVGGFVFLLLVPRLLRALARVTARRWPGVTMRLLGVVEHLQPGMGARQERDALAMFLEVRRGEPSRALETLREVRAQAQDVQVRRSIDERITWALLASARWEEAVAHFERHLDGQPGPVSGALLVEMLKGYGALGRLTRVASLFEQLERSPLAHEPALAPVHARARMVFLAFTGRSAAVEHMLGKGGALGELPPAARAYWRGIACHTAGDAAGLAARQAELARLAPRDPHVAGVVDEELRRLAATPPAPVPDDVLALARDIERLAMRMPPLRVVGAGERGLPLTLSLVAVNLLVALAIRLQLGTSTDPWVLVDAGANLSDATRAGEWWRLGASTVIHVGVLHLAVNLFALWSLGGLTERVFGPARLAAIYLAAGLAGAALSAYGGGTRLSAGASGAIFGLIGAAIAEVALRRHAYAPAWRRRMLSGLVTTALLNLAVGQLVPAIDQLAHVGGLVGGFLVGALLSPNGGLRGPRGQLVAGVLATSLAALVTGSVAVAWRTTPVDTLRHLGDVAIEERGVALEVPRLWTEVELPAQLGTVYGDDDRPLDEVARALNADSVTGTGLAAVAGPAPEPRWHTEGWSSDERLAEVAEDEHLRYRVATFVRRPDPTQRGVLAVSVALPERYATLFADEVRRVLTTARVARPIPPEQQSAPR